MIYSKPLKCLEIFYLLKFIPMLKTMTLKKETEDNTNEWNDLPCSWIKELILLKCHYYQSHL